MTTSPARMVDEATTSAVRWLRMSERERDEGAALTLADIERVYLEQAQRYARAAALIIGERGAAEDAVQDAFARAIVYRGKFRGTGSLEAWLWRIVVNTSLNGRRRLRTEEPVLDDVAHRERATAEPEIDHQARRVVLRLPRRQRAAVFLRYYADLDYEQIAAVLSVTPGGVAKLLHDAHATLARTMERPR